MTPADGAELPQLHTAEPRAITQAYRFPPVHSFPPADQCTKEDLIEIASSASSGSMELLGSPPHVERLCQLIERMDRETVDLSESLDSERNAHQVSVLDLEAARGLLGAAQRETFRLQHLLAAREAEIVMVRRQLARAIEQIADAQLAEPTITHVSYEKIVAHRRPQVDIARRKHAHEPRIRPHVPPMTLDDDDATVVEMPMVVGVPL